MNGGVPTHARADFRVAPRLGVVTPSCLEPRPGRLIPECSEVKAKGTVRKGAEARESGQFGEV